MERYFEVKILSEYWNDGHVKNGRVTDGCLVFWKTGYPDFKCKKTVLQHWMFLTFTDKLTAEQENYSATMEIHLSFKIFIGMGWGPPHHGEVLRGQAALRVLEWWSLLVVPTQFKKEGVPVLFKLTGHHLGKQQKTDSEKKYFLHGVKWQW